MLYFRRAGYPALLFWSFSMRFLLYLPLFLLVSCSSIQPGGPIKEEEQVSVLTGKAGGWVISDLGSKKKSTTSLPVNAIAWRAALDTASLLPLADVDTFAGTIVTEWYSLPNRADERIKLTIFVVGRELRSDSVSVRVHVQRRSANGWSDTARDEAFARQIEDLILSRARELRAESLAEITD
tara:strand:- start:518 stop:1063 length:546 start_codon:yes stop_codon:yes gene_type:complete